MSYIGTGENGQAAQQGYKLTEKRLVDPGEHKILLLKQKNC